MTKPEGGASDIGECGECGMPAQLVTCVHDDFSGQDCPGSLGGSPWRPSALGSDTTPDDLRQTRARAYADGVLAGRAGITDTRLPGSNDDEEDDRG